MIILTFLRSRAIASLCIILAEIGPITTPMNATASNGATENKRM